MRPVRSLGALGLEDTEGGQIHSAKKKDTLQKFTKGENIIPPNKLRLKKCCLVALCIALQQIFLWHSRLNAIVFLRIATLLQVYHPGFRRSELSLCKVFVQE